jgi:hypothetical protein
MYLLLDPGGYRSITICANEDVAVIVVSFCS